MEARKNLVIFVCVAVMMLAAARVDADFVFGQPQNVGPVVNSPSQDATPFISADGLSLFFSSDRQGGVGGADIWVSTRATTQEAWGTPVNLGAPVNTSASEGRPSITADGLIMVFTDFTWFNSVRRPGGKGGSDLWMTTRATINAPWGAPVNLSELNSSIRDEDPSISPDGLTLYFNSNRSGSAGSDIWMTTRATRADRWGEPVRLGPNVNSTSSENGPCISADGLMLFFDSTRASGGSCLDMFMSARKTVSEPFGPARKLPVVGTCSGRTSVSFDGRTLYYESLWDEALGSGQEDLWQVPILPVVDLNGDGKVDAKDMTILADHWGRSEQVCDLGPMPWGDGIVDEKDMGILLEAVVSPAPHASEIPCDAILNWLSAPFAQTQDVYFGTSLDDVRGANRVDPRGVLVSQDQTVTTYDPGGLLEFGRTYYWRVDFVIPGPTATICKGPVLDFTTEALAYPIHDITATASGAEAGMGPERTVDGSGLDNSDGHSAQANDMWLCTGASPHWIEFEFDKIYALREMRVWNSNQLVEPLVGFGVKHVMIEYSTDGAIWTQLDGVPEFARAPGKPGYTANTTISFGSRLAKYVKLTVENGWGTTPSAGLSEVRFLHIPMAARAPEPADGATDVYPQVTLSWHAGREAAVHDVYIGPDRQAVAGGTAPLTTVGHAKYELPLDLEQTYYWKVVEVGPGETPSAWPSGLWSFSTLPYITVDDFERYTNGSPKRVFQTWIDGSGFSSDTFFPEGGVGNGTGSLVGHEPLAGDIMETVYTYRGRQSMPLLYDNSTAPHLSEVVRRFDPPQDWTRHGITALTLFFRGDVNNADAPVYTKINDTKVTYNNGVAAAATPLWKQWNIDLASCGADLQRVEALTIGIGDGTPGGTGTILIDEICLYATPPQTILPTDPGPDDLAALYSMEGNVQDGSGKNLHGTVFGNPSYVQGPAGHDQALNFDGGNDYVDLPIGTLISTLTDSTFAVWINFSETGGLWPLVFSFTTGTTHYMYLTPQSYKSGPVRFGIATPAVSEQGVENQVTLPAGWHHVAVVIDSAAMQIKLYIDGTQVADGPTTLLPNDLGVTTTNWLGRSQWGDPYYRGSLDDLRIYSRVLSAGEILYLAGGR